MSWKYQVDGRGGLELRPRRVSGHDRGNEWLRQCWEPKSLKEEEEFKDLRALGVRKIILLETPRVMMGILLIGTIMTGNLNVQMQGGSYVCEDLQ